MIVNVGDKSYKNDCFKRQECSPNRSQNDTKYGDASFQNQSLYHGLSAMYKSNTKQLSQFPRYVKISARKMAEEQIHPNEKDSSSYRNIVDYSVLPQRRMDLSQLDQHKLVLDKSPIRDILKNMQTAFARSKSTQQIATVAKMQENRQKVQKTGDSRNIYQMAGTSLPTLVKLIPGKKSPSEVTPQGLTINTVRNSTEYQSPELSPVHKQLKLQALNGGKNSSISINVGNTSQRPNQDNSKSQVFYIKKDHERNQVARKTNRIISDQIHVSSRQSSEMVVRPDELFKVRDAGKSRESNKRNGVTKSRQRRKQTTTQMKALIDKPTRNYISQNRSQYDVTLQSQYLSRLLEVNAETKSKPRYPHITNNPTPEPQRPTEMPKLNNNLLRNRQSELGNVVFKQIAVSKPNHQKQLYQQIKSNRYQNDNPYENGPAVAIRKQIGARNHHSVLRNPSFLMGTKKIPYNVNSKLHTAIYMTNRYEQASAAFQTKSSDETEDPCDVLQTAKLNQSQKMVSKQNQIVLNLNKVIIPNVQEQTFDCVSQESLTNSETQVQVESQSTQSKSKAVFSKYKNMDQTIQKLEQAKDQVQKERQQMSILETNDVTDKHTSIEPWTTEPQSKLSNSYDFHSSPASDTLKDDIFGSKLTKSKMKKNANNVEKQRVVLQKSGANFNFINCKNI